MVGNKTTTAARQLFFCSKQHRRSGDVQRDARTMVTERMSKTYVIASLFISCLSVCSVHDMRPVDDDKCVTTQDHCALSRVHSVTGGHSRSVVVSPYSYTPLFIT